MSEGVTPPQPGTMTFRVAIFVIVVAILGVIYFELTTPQPTPVTPAPAPSSSFISECA